MNLTGTVKTLITLFLGSAVSAFADADYGSNWAEVAIPATDEKAVVFEVPANSSSEVVVSTITDTAPQSLGKPVFVTESLFSSGRALVFGVAQMENEDVVLLDNGYDQGFRNGMICEVIRGEQLVGEIILVEVRTDRAAGLITALEEGNTIKFNDTIRIKTIQFTDRTQ